MSSSMGMETYAARLASFDVAHPAAKKRTSSTKSAKTLKWPHKTPLPVQLAKAGFYYRPKASDPDNTACFLCNNNLDGWEEDDDPITEHLKHSPNCGWAINAGIEKDIENGIHDEENPLSEKMLEARRSTFDDMWPHDGKRGWTCKTQKMVEAGWYYCPTPESDDFVKCPYCSLGLDGWEPKDNAYDEHHRRSPGCAFFILTTSINSKPIRANKSRASKISRMSTQSNMSTISEPTNSKPVRVTKGRASKLSRISAQSNMSTVSMDPSLVDIQMGEDQGALANGTDINVKSTAVKGSQKSEKSKKVRSTARNKVAKAKTEDEKADGTTQASSFVEPEDDDFAVKIEATKPQHAKGKKRTSSELDTNDQAHGIDAEISGPPTKRRATRTRSCTVKPQPIHTSVMPVVAVTQIKEHTLAAPTSPLRQPLNATVPSLTPSPQSSNAENRPPSSRPLQKKTSPTRGAPLRLQTTLPWSAVDLENIFLERPEAKNENDPVATAQVLADTLTSSEKKLTVEDWIKYNARKGEERLRNECERVVGKFESEGVKALKVLEGIVCLC